MLFHNEISKKEIYNWQRFKKVKPEKQPLGIFLSLEGEARADIVQIDLKELDKEDDVRKVLKELKKSYIKDKSQLIYEA